MKRLLTVALLIALGGPIGADQPPKNPAAPVKKAPAAKAAAVAGRRDLGRRADHVEALRGKTVIILVYAPHPDAEQWAAPFFEKLKEAIRDKPIVVLAIDASKKGDADFAYAKAKGCSAPNIILGRDLAMPARLGLECEFFEYARVDPEGQLAEATFAGVCWGKRPAGTPLPKMGLLQTLEIRAYHHYPLGSFRLLTDDMTPKVKHLLWPLELGRYMPESSLKAAKHKLTEEEQQCIDKTLDRFLAAQIDALEKLCQGEPAERLRCYEKAAALAAVYKGRDEAGKADAMVKELARDAKFKRELAAKRAFQKAMQQAGDDLAAQARSMARLAKSFKGTYYGQLAANGGKAPEVFHPFILNTLILLPEAEQKKLVAKQQAAYEEVRKKLPGIDLPRVRKQAVSLLQ